jgi:hypothetical protein
MLKRCPNEAQDRKRCDPCAAKVNGQNQSYYAKLKAAGICITCCTASAIPARVRCTACTEKALARCRAYREGKRAAPARMPEAQTPN